MSAYKLQKLTESVGGIISGPLSPMLFAETISKHFEQGLVAVYRVNFEEPSLYQEPDEPGFLTGYDTLLVVMTSMVAFAIDRGVSCDLVAFAIDRGVSCDLVAAAFGDYEIEIKPIENSAYVKQLEVQQVEALMFKAQHGIYKAEAEALAAWRAAQ